MFTTLKVIRDAELTIFMTSFSSQGDVSVVTLVAYLT
jgi:hypothetical protein